MVMDLVIPVRDEGPNLMPLVHRLEHLIPQTLGRAFFVEGGSSDDTRAILDRLAEEKQWLNVVDCSVIGDLGAVWRAGVDCADARRWVAFMDADLCHAPEELTGWLTYVQNNPGLVMIIGSRFKQTLLPMMKKPMYRRGITKLVQMLFRLQFGNKLTDPVHGFRMVQGKVLAAFRRHENENGLVAGNTWMFALTVFCQNQGMIHELPIQYGVRAAGRDKLQAWREGTRLLRWWYSTRGSKDGSR